MIDSSNTIRKMRNADWVADRLGLRVNRVYQLCREGVLPCIRIGRQLRIDEHTLEAWAAAQNRVNSIGFVEGSCL